MTTEKSINFDTQKLIVSNDIWKAELWFENINAENKIIKANNYSKIIDLSEKDYLGSLLAIKTTNNLGEYNNCLITGIDGGTYLHDGDKIDKCQSVKLLDNNLILSTGFTFFSFNIEKQEIEWKLRPDISEVFEFYDLQDDFLLRGELEIHRIDINGNIKWSYGGKDIWVNIDGKKEVCIENDKIKLTDFESNIYVIDFNGNTLKKHPTFIVGENRKNWWKFWK
ncbi:hypothetical protein [Flavobacterium urocaniciphilum]|uniref:PQQ-like domain-containing protein n=1 Tax=Flavobacterium urocaniciphilum TaxID=1299341 RepID=A0A1H9D5G7_9FLAO|nr:hypothetical protein [Flavobacterium urocaniciphilum]SEQ08048.1 hypothetical protein SAMN05444005_10613 [Flavobacterium urocaniciphilum]